VNDELLEVLLDNMRDGDSRAAEQVFLAYEPELRLLVRRQLSRRLRAKFDSLDVVQSVWVHVLRDFRDSGCGITSPAHLRNFLVRVACNCLTDRFRPLPHGPWSANSHCWKATGQARLSQVSRAPARSPRPTICGRPFWRTAPREHHELLRLKRHGLPSGGHRRPHRVARRQRSPRPAQVGATGGVFHGRANRLTGRRTVGNKCSVVESVRFQRGGSSRRRFGTPLARRGAPPRRGLSGGAPGTLRTARSGSSS